MSSAKWRPLCHGRNVLVNSSPEYRIYASLNWAVIDLDNGMPSVRREAII